MTRQEKANLWFAIARNREKAGDKEGAEQARNNARMLRGGIARNRRMKNARQIPTDRGKHRH